MSTIKDELFNDIMKFKNTEFSSFVEIQESLDLLIIHTKTLLKQIIDKDVEITQKNKIVFSQLAEHWNPQIKWTLSVSLSINEFGKSNCAFVLHLSSTIVDIEEAAYSYLNSLKAYLNNALLRTSDEAVVQHLHSLHERAVNDSCDDLAKKIAWFIETDYNVDVIEYSDVYKEFFDENYVNGIDCNVTTKKAIVNKITKDVVSRGIVCKPRNDSPEKK